MVLSVVVVSGKSVEVMLLLVDMCINMGVVCSICIVGFIVGIVISGDFIVGGNMGLFLSYSSLELKFKRLSLCL